MYINEPFRKIWVYTGKRLLVCNLMLLVFAAAFEQLYLVYFSELISSIIGAEFTFEVIGLVLLLISLNVLLAFLTKISLNLCRIDFIKNVKQKFFSSICLSKEYKKDTFSDIATRNSENINSLAYLYDGVYSNVFRCFTRCIFAFAVISRISIIIALISIMIPVLYNLVFIINGKNLNRMQGAEWRRNNRSNEFFDEINASLTAAQGLNVRNSFMKRADYLLENARNVKFLISGFWARVSAGDFLLTQAFPIVLIGMMMLFSRNRKGIGDVYTILYNVPIFLSLVWDFDINAFNRFYFAFSKIEEYFIHKEPDISEKPLVRFENLEFRDVCVRKNDRCILRKCSFTISRNDKVLIYGPSGAGKSTLIDIILGNIMDFDGSVRLNGQYITSLKRENIYSLLAYSSDSTYFFTGTVYKNLMLTNKNDVLPKLTKSRLIRSKLYCSRINESFSAGEKCMLSYVNTISSIRDVLIFDETCANLDVENLRKVINQIKNINEKTMIFVSHNPEIISSKDVFTKTVSFGDLPGSSISGENNG